MVPVDSASLHPNASPDSGVRPHREAPANGNGALFAVDGTWAFYRSLIRRHYRLFAAMMVLSAIYAALAASRLFAGGVLIDCVKVRVGGVMNSGSVSSDLGGAPKFLPALDEKLVEWGFLQGSILEQLGDDGYFQRFLLASALVFVVVAVVMVIASFFKEYLGQALVVRMVVDIRTALFDHLTRQSVAYFNRQQSGDIVSRLTNDISAIQLAFRFFFQTIVHEPLTIIASLAVAYYASPFLFIFVVPLYGFLVLPILRQSKKVTKHGRGRLEKLSLVTEDIHQLFSGIRIVKAFGMERYERQEFAQRNQGYIKSTLRMNRAKIKGRSWQELLYNVGTAALVLFGVWLYAEEYIEATSFFVFLAAMIQIYAPIKAFSRAWNQVQESSAGVTRVLEILREPAGVEDKDGALDFPGVTRRIAFEDVSFDYCETARNGDGAEVQPPNAPVIRSLSFEVRPGEVVALVGPSGAGKTTIADLLARFYDPQAGRITVDGTDIRNFRRASYLEGIAIVSQDPFLFNSTIRENISYGRAGASQEEIEQAARVACAHDFIVEQPEGYDTVLGERGVKLSGGQRQRLTIARAVLKNAPILILDEATSALDTRSEREVQRAIDNLMRSRTTFVIAHRLSTIVHADKILVLEVGQLKEMGRHADLLGRKGKYYHLWKSQNPQEAAESDG